MYSVSVAPIIVGAWETAPPKDPTTYLSLSLYLHSAGVRKHASAAMPIRWFRYVVGLLPDLVQPLHTESAGGPHEHHDARPVEGYALRY